MLGGSCDPLLDSVRASLECDSRPKPSNSQRWGRYGLTDRRALSQSYFLAPYSLAAF